MNYFSIRTNDQTSIGKILNNDKEMTFGTLSWHKDDILIGDIIFIVVSGDSAKKLHEYDNGLRAIGRVKKLPKKEEDGTHYSLKVEIFLTLSKSLTKNDFYLYPSLKDAPNIGPETKNPPNQAIRIIEEKVGKDIIKAIVDICNDTFVLNNLKSLIEDDTEILKYIPDKKNINSRKEKSEIQKRFDPKIFSEALSNINLRISDNLLIRFISALLTKPFVILTGLSGSGKSKLGLALAAWLNENKAHSKLKKFVVGEEINSSRLTYRVIATDTISVTFEQIDSGTKVNLPYELIFEWIKVIKERNFTRETPIKTIRDLVQTNYSPYLNSFDSHLSTAAFNLIDKDEETGIIKPRYKFISVGSDWTNREPLLGYPNALELGKYVKPEHSIIDLLIEATSDENKHLPYFIILDEMNLSHVERYFADFLSAMESGEPVSLHNDDTEWKDETPAKIMMPDNVFFIGTVNIDETTYMFSPKVLDRANVLEFKVTAEEMDDFLNKPVKTDLSPIAGLGNCMAEDFLKISRKEITVFDSQQEIKETFLKFFGELKKIGAEFGYRTASDIFRFTAQLTYLTERSGNKWRLNDIIDAAVMQKLLPKIHGSRSKLEPVLKTLALLCLTESDDNANLIDKPENINYQDRTKVLYPISLEKILRMKKRVVQDGFTSFAEA
ncbi:MAG: hypothetical protein KF816_06425 [Melioribacteraceae bacterium]|nr:hypothetical protein [Melioribacteraceae bacterium]